MNDILVTGSTILGAFVSIITLVIALLLYKKFGIDETIFSKRVEIVFQLLKLVRSKTFWIETRELKLHMPLSVMDKNRFESFQDVPLLFSEEYYDFIKDIFGMADDYYMPKQIAEKIKMNEPSFLSYPTDINLDEFGKVGFASIGQVEKWGLQDNKSLTLKEFVVQWIDLIEAIKAWIKNHSNDDENINI